MRQFLLGLSVSVAFMLGCVTANLSQSTANAGPDHAPKEEVVTHYQRWDYLCLWRASEKELRAAGAEGWELVTVSDSTACLKRPL